MNQDLLMTGRSKGRGRPILAQQQQQQQQQQQHHQIPQQEQQQEQQQVFNLPQQSVLAQFHQQLTEQLQLQQHQQLINESIFNQNSLNLIQALLAQQQQNLIQQQQQQQQDQEQQIQRPKSPTIEPPAQIDPLQVDTNNNYNDNLFQQFHKNIQMQNGTITVKLNQHTSAAAAPAIAQKSHLSYNFSSKSSSKYSQFEDDDEDLCSVCDRDCNYVLCTNCGKTFKVSQIR
jgi:hypothetical protein